ncbi:MAG TPA: potassium-transporting ATPase subunit KdpC [Ignavibacteria bacterium]|nr:potassium-transporting ATPase subunit KdpC [Ignavibacteria bacterium]HRF67196.1 potassium-transporting ATPase subunit KdpC [Ignavibacteria bacterium]HRJ03149.1 potassium-transporting ATPase subunit KdpC [Ignavibacteria bacterium]
MIKNLKSSLILTVILILMFGVVYPLGIYTIGLVLPSNSVGSPIVRGGRTIGFENIGQSFTDDKYFWGRPSAVNYNAASTGGSNKGPTNPDYLAEVQARIDTFLVHNPGVKKEEIPSDLVTASGSGIDPNITPNSAYIQVKRIAVVRNLPEAHIKALVDQSIENTVLGMPVINVLKLNLKLDELK